MLHFIGVFIPIFGLFAIVWVIVYERFRRERPRAVIIFNIIWVVLSVVLSVALSTMIVCGYFDREPQKICPWPGREC